MMRTHRGRFLGFALVGMCLLSALHILRLPRIVVDDAFISYRYALQWISGNGLVFNVGEHVEGYSNPLWVWLTALGMLLRADPVAWTRSLGATACLGCVILTAWQTWRLSKSWAACAAAGLLLSTATAFCSSALSGLETGLFSLCLTAAAALFIGRRYLSASLVIAVAGMTRPEGFALMFVAAVCLALSRSRRDRSRPAVWVRLITPALLALMGLLTFRLCYYGAWTPNSVLAKSAMFAQLRSASIIEMPGLVLNKSGMAYVAGFFASTLGLATLLCILPLLLARSRRSAAMLLTLVSLQGCAVAVYNFGDWMASYRLLTPYLPILVILACWGAVLAVKRASTSLPPMRSTIVTATVVGLVLTTPLFSYQRNLPVPSVRPDFELAKLLECSRQPDLLAATDVLGRLGYYAPAVRIIDMAGLTDAYIARNGESKPTFGKWDMKYVLSHRPDFLMTNVLSGWRDVLPDGQFQLEYAWLDEPTWRSGANVAARYVFIRRGTVLEREMKAAYPAAILRNPSRAAESVSAMAAESCANDTNHAS